MELNSWHVNIANALWVTKFVELRIFSMEMYETKVNGLYIVFLETEGNSRDGNKSFLDSIDTGEMLRWWDDIF